MLPVSSKQMPLGTWALYVHVQGALVEGQRLARGTGVNQIHWDSC